MIVYAVSKGLTSGNNLNKRINRYKRGPSQHFASQAGRQRGWWNVGRDSIPDGHGSRRPNFRLRLRVGTGVAGHGWCAPQSAPAERGVRITGEIEMLIKCRAVRVH